MEAKAWSSAEVDAALSRSFGPAREESGDPEETRKQENDHRDHLLYLFLSPALYINYIQTYFKKGAQVSY